MKKFALIGNPNCGKTTLFNALTGATARVGNWPGVTVEKKVGVYKSDKIQAEIVDLPGIYSLSPYTPEENISKNYLLDEKPDCIINIVDITNLERNLYLTTQLMEMDIPIVVALNMCDILQKEKLNIDITQLNDKFGIPFIKISATNKKNIKELINLAYEESNKTRFGKSIIDNKVLNQNINKIKDYLEENQVKNPLFFAIKIIEGQENKWHNDNNITSLISSLTENYKDETFDKDFESIIANERYIFITNNCPKKVKLDGSKPKKELTRTDKIDKVITNRIIGIPIFLLILFLIFHLTFSEDLFYLQGWFNTFGNDGLISFAGTTFEGLFANGGINSPGVILFNLLDIATSSITSFVSGLLQSSPTWVQGFICDGVLGGLFAVLSFVPQILLLFLFFSILEDTGYMARVAFILDRIFRKFGLSGKAFMPMIMGFGCSIPAMVNTRTLANEKEKIATIRVIPFFSCGAKLPILTAIAGGIVQYFGVGNADLITFSMYLLGMVTALCCIIIMRLTTMKGEIAPFIMELPNYHIPKFSSLMIHLWDKLKHFIKKAFTIILFSTIIIWFISHFSWNYTFLEDKDINQSILANLGQLIQPIFTPLGFGVQLSSWGWVFAVGAITGLIAKENVIATFGTLAACIVINFSGDEEGIDAVVAMINATGINISGLISFIAFNLLTIPCFAAVATAKAELPKKSFKYTIAFWLVVSYIVSTIIYLVGTWYWTLFIILAILGIAITILIITRKKVKLCNQLK